MATRSTQCVSPLDGTQRVRWALRSTKRAPARLSDIAFDSGDRRKPDGVLRGFNLSGFIEGETWPRHTVILTHIRAALSSDAYRPYPRVDILQRCPPLPST